MTAPNAKQEQLANLAVSEILVIAPAGCGKTEALAVRAAAVCSRGLVRPPRKVLAVTFSNKAKANLAARVRMVMGAEWRDKVTVTNFHGLAGRLIQAHGKQLGLPMEVKFPEKTWRARAARELGVRWQDSDDFEAALREAKQDAAADDIVMERLVRDGNPMAIAFEERLRADSRLDYDDLLRHAARLLSIPEVRHLYQAHFGMVMVDEVQDLTLMQLGIIQAIGAGRTTYAGDPAQGIYSFAGAQPESVFSSIRSLQPVIVEFDESYRSAPAVLAAVNSLAAELGSTQLRCADSSRWPDNGHVVVIRTGSPDEEADKLVGVLASILGRYPDTSVGIVVRRQTRLRSLKTALVGKGQTFEDWSAPTHVPKVAGLLRRFVAAATASASDAEVQLNALEAACRGKLDASDVVGLDEVSAACEDLRALVEGGMSVQEAVSTCRQAALTDAPVAPGLHLLTGHLGKGQEFDWVVVMGLEDGHIPDYRATEPQAIQEELRVLHVMVSRARYGLLLTCSETQSTSFGPRLADESRWLAILEAVATSSA
jgi:DNA helicase-2/ATP-dependent DNA helicase PcrA